VAAAVLTGVFGFASCSFAPPQTIRLRGLEADLASDSFDLPYALDKFSASLSDDMSLALYNPGDGIQHLLVAMNLEESRNEIDIEKNIGEGSGSVSVPPINFNTTIPQFVGINPSLYTFRNRGGADIKYVSDVKPIKARIAQGKLTIIPAPPITKEDLCNVVESPSGGIYIDYTVAENDYKDQYLRDYEEDGEGLIFDLKDVVLDNSSRICIKGLADALPDGATVNVKFSVSKFSSVTVSSATSADTTISLIPFGDKSVSENPEDLAKYIYHMEFYSIGINFQLNRRVEGLKLEFFYNKNLLTGDLLPLPGPATEPFAEGTSSLGDDFLLVTAENVALNIVNQDTEAQILYELSALARPSGTTVTLEDVSPGETVTVTATFQFPPTFHIKQAVVNPQKIPDGLNLNMKIPDPDNGEAPINLAELLKAVDDFLPMENLSLSPRVSLYLNDDLPENIKLKIEADTDDGTPENLLPVAGFTPVNDAGGRIPVFSGTEYTGALPPPALSLDGDKLMELLHSKPESLRLAIDAELANPTTINFSEDAAANALIIKPSILLDLPLELKLRAGSPAADYAAVKLTQADDSGKADLFARNSAQDPLINIGGIAPEEINLTLDYVNTLGAALDLAITSTDFAGSENFRKIISLRSGNSETLTFHIKSSDLPFPFQPGFEALIPADQTDGQGNYGVLKIVPGGIVRVSNLRADVQFGLDLTGGM
jgi:hypothetical protein